ncbi:MAG: hypothetical protein KF773_15440 [Deltaproteobacteria bacterium]|nr:hypothetical protein [Deltaproteobacteria bacterium]MCW5807416.1 hypothetical protein [Deltaproteobacteria bacterium]
MRRALLALAIPAAACGGKSDDPAPKMGSGSGAQVVRVPDKIAGKLHVNGVAQELVACVPGQTPAPDPHTFVAVITRNGAVRFENQALHWSLDTTGKTRGEALTCEKLDRSWGGGEHRETPNTYYWRGKLSFRCRGNAGEITGELELDCGNLTAAEREKLDRQREDLLRRQQAPAVP